MSLLLQALQKAAKSRDGGTLGDAPTIDTGEESLGFEIDAGKQEPAADALRLADDDLLDTRRQPEVEVEVEPEFDNTAAVSSGPLVARSPSARFERLGAAASSAQAATVLRASDARAAGWVDWVRDRPVHAFAILAAIFMVFYGAFVYLQIFHPSLLRGSFLSQKPLRATTPPPPPSPISQAPQPAPAAPTATAPEPAAAPPASPIASQTARGSPSKATPLTPKGARADPDDSADGLESDDVQAPTPKARPRRTPPTRSASLSRGEDASGDAMQDTVAVRQPGPATASVNTLLMRAWEALQRGQMAEAEDLYERVHQSEPQSVDALLGLAVIAAQRGNGDQAARYYGDALDLEPRNPTAQAGLISILGQADPQLSESRLKHLISREPSANLYFALGNLYAGQRLWAQAQQAYFQAYQLAPDNPDYAYNLAVGLEHLSQPKIALNYYLKAVELSNLKGHASFDTGRVQNRIGQLTARVGTD